MVRVTRDYNIEYSSSATNAVSIFAQPNARSSLPSVLQHDGSLKLIHFVNLANSLFVRYLPR